MKAAKRIAALCATALVFAGCGSNTSGSGASGNCGDAGVFCIGMVTDGGKIDDKSFNQSAWEGIENAAKQIDGAKTKYIETVSANDFAGNIKKFTDGKYNVIVTVGFNLVQATVDAAKANPQIKFIGVDQDQAEAKLSNLTGLVFPEDQAGYAAGYLAGKLSKTNKVGQVLGMQIPPVERYALGFDAGAKAANPATTVTTVYHPAGDNAFSDPTWGAAESQKQLDQKVDVIFGAGGTTGNGALGQVAKASGAGSTIFCIGVDTDQWDTVPEAQKCLVASALKLIGPGTTDLVLKAKAGDLPSGDYVGQAGLSGYHDFDSKLPADVKADVAKVVAGLKDGSIKTGVKLS